MCRIGDIRGRYRRRSDMVRLDSVPYSKMHQASLVLSKIFSALGPPSQIHLRSFSTLLGSRKRRRALKRDAARERKLLEMHERVREKYAHIYDSLSKTAKLKLALYEEQGGMCPYSMQRMDEARLLGDRSYADVDHILPLSRNGENRYENKILVITEKNREKDNRTPREYIGGEAGRWDEYEKWVRKNIADPMKRDNLLCVGLDGPVDDENRPVVENLSRWLAEWVAQSGRGEHSDRIDVTTAFVSGEGDSSKVSLIHSIERKKAFDAATLEKIVPGLACFAENEIFPECASPQGIARDIMLRFLTPRARLSLTKTDGTLVQGTFVGLDASSGSIHIRESDGKRRSVSPRKIRALDVEDAPYGKKIGELIDWN